MLLATLIFLLDFIGEQLGIILYHYSLILSPITYFEPKKLNEVSTSINTVVEFGIPNRY